MSAQLYRHFDAQDTLPYVGVSINTMLRLAQHKAASDWFPNIAKVTVQHFPSRGEALRAERVAIQSENPRFNKDHIVPRIVPQFVGRPFSHVHRNGRASREGGVLRLDKIAERRALDPLPQEQKRPEAEYTIAHVAKRLGVSVKTVRRYTALSRPAWRRLKVIKRSPRNHRIPESALLEFDRSKSL